MTRKKGFTLIELLAVIVVLAIIALIATPIVLNLIESSKKGAAEQSAVSYVKAVENGIMSKLVEDPTATIIGTFTVSSDRTKIVNTSGMEIKAEVSGDLPAQGGTIVIDANGSVTNAFLTIKEYPVSYKNGKAEVVEDSHMQSAIEYLRVFKEQYIDKGLIQENTYMCVYFYKYKHNDIEYINEGESFSCNIVDPEIGSISSYNLNIEPMLLNYVGEIPTIVYVEPAPNDAHLTFVIDNVRYFVNEAGETLTY